MLDSQKVVYETGLIKARKAYRETKKKFIDNLFKGLGLFYESSTNEIDVPM